MPMADTLLIFCYIFILFCLHSFRTVIIDVVSTLCFCVVTVIVMTIQGAFIFNYSYLTLLHKSRFCTSHVHYTYALVPRVMSSLPLLRPSNSECSSLSRFQAVSIPQLQQPQQPHCFLDHYSTCQQ
jgi:hypothetical protein